MHIQRCDDPAYLSFARHLLRSLSNVKNGTVTKHIGEVTVTVRKVFGHEYVSISSTGVWYEFFTTGDVYDCLFGVNLKALAASDTHLMPEGYFIRASANGGASVLLSTHRASIGDKKINYVKPSEFFGRKTAISRSIQVSLITEPVYESKFGARCESVWSQRPTPLSDYGYDVVGNKLSGFKSTPHVADTDWPRTVAITTREYTDLLGHINKVKLMVIVTQTWDVCVYRTSDASEPYHKHPIYQQLWLTTKDNAKITTAKIPLPDGIEVNHFSGSARELYGKNPSSYLENHRRMCVRLNSDCTKLCFTYDKTGVYPNAFIEFALNILLDNNGAVSLSMQKTQEINAINDKLRVFDCDYLMPAKGHLKKKFDAVGCKEGDLIILCQKVRTLAGYGTFADDNYIYVVNKTTGVVIIDIPSSYVSVNYEPIYETYGTPTTYTEMSDAELVSYINSNNTPVRYNANPYVGFDYLSFEFLDLKSLSLSVIIENGVDASTYALFVHGVLFAKAGDFDTLFNVENKQHKFGVHSYKIFTQGAWENVETAIFYNYLDTDNWFDFTDPTHNFVTDVNGNWSHHSFFYRDFFGKHYNAETGVWLGDAWLSNFTHKGNVISFKDLYSPFRDKVF